MMTKPGMTVSRWFDGVLEKNEVIDQPSNLRGMFYWGHAPNSQTRGLDMKKAMDKLDLLVVVDPFPSATAAMAAMPGKAEDQNPNRAVYLLPACTQFETSGSVTASNRSMQWREKVIEPLYEPQRPHDHVPAGQKLGFGKELVKNYKMQKVKGHGRARARGHPARDQPRVWTIGYTGQSPERLKAHMRNMHVFDVKTLRAKGGIDKETGYKLDGEYFGLPWPCWGTPEMKHPGTQPVRHLGARDGRRRQLPRQLRRRARRPVAAGGRRLAQQGRRPDHRLPRVRPPAAEEAGLVGRPDRAEKKAAEGKNWKTDPSGGIIRVAMKPRLPPVRQRQGARRGLELPGPDPAAPRAAVQHPAGAGRAKYPTHDDRKTFWRLPTLYKSVQDKNKDIGKTFPLILTSGRLVEYEGGGDETRSNRTWPSCSRTCSSRSTRGRPTTAASATARTCG
jgi:formate dehydrogenase major subunit